VLVRNYSSRDLAFDSDALNAFTGIMKQFETSKHPILQLLGIPYLHPDLPDTQTQEHLNYAVAGFCWRHTHCCWSDPPKARRRYGFPSWTWAGWVGAISWMDAFSY